MTTQTKTKQTEVRPLVAVDAPVLTSNDVGLLVERENLKAELKRLDKHLKERITNTIEAKGTGTMVIGDRQVELKRSIRNSVAWKPLCYSLNEEEAIQQVLDVFTEPVEINSAKVVS